MWGLIGPAFKAIAAALAVWKQERAIYNRPDMIAYNVAVATQQSRDAVRNAEAVLSDPKATPEAHADALRQLRLAGS